MDQVGTTKPKPFVFVLMPFDNKFSDIYKFGIKGAAEEVGAFAERLDEQIFQEGMLERIFNQINKADVIVADMTGRNPNVFYEVGYAHALGKLVLLLTQNADDIPFDLKQRQHTVYGGEISTLKSELVKKLKWAIRESQNRPGNTLDSISLYLIQMKLLRARGEIDNVPQISSRISRREFSLPLAAKNDGPELVSGISHVYMFTTEESGIIPAQLADPLPASMTGGIGIPVVTKPLTFLPSVPFYQELERVYADDENDTHGLTSRYRLPITFSAIPPNAIETVQIGFKFRDGVSACDDRFRIRLHTSNGEHDYLFQLNLKYEPDGE